jgi:hypothetical protein
MPIVAAAAVVEDIFEGDMPSRRTSIAGEPLLERHVEADVAPSWTGRSFDFSDLREQSSGQESPGDEQFVAEIEAPAWYTDEPADDTNEISVDETFDQFARGPAGPVEDVSAPPAPPVSPPSSLPTRGGAAPALPTRSADLGEPLLETSAPAPAAFAAPTAEFDRVPAPPVTTGGLTNGPVTPHDALPPATLRVPESPEIGLPTRTPGRGPDGPDRLAPPTSPAVMTDPPIAATSSPSALQAALTAFDSRRNGHDTLPTRERRAIDAAAPESFEEPASIAQSRLDPDVLRERLRAFQNEFRTATTGGNNSDHDHSSTTDSGGDRR